MLPLHSPLNPCVKITVCFHYTHPIHVSGLQTAYITLTPHPHLALIAACSYQSFNLCVRITVCFHHIHPSLSSSPNSSLLISTLQFMCQDYSLFADSLTAQYLSQDYSLLLSNSPRNLCVRITVSFQYTHPSIHVSRLQSASTTLTLQSMWQDYSLLPLHLSLNHMSTLQSVFTTLTPQYLSQDYSMLPLHSSLNPCVRITVCFHYTHTNTCVKITVCFHYTHPSIHVARLQYASITLTPIFVSRLKSASTRLTPQSMCQDYSLLPIHSLPDTCVKITV